jgi:hypothetical protein
MDYKKTLNLPKTGFPMKANLAGREPNQLDSLGNHGIIWPHPGGVQRAAHLYAA